MSRHLKVRGLTSSLQPSAFTEGIPLFSQMLAAAQVDAAAIAQINSETRYFQLGEEIFSQPSPSSDFYFIAQGQVRLLCQGAYHSRAVTALLLEAGKGFGADQLFVPTPLPYRAIAVEPVQIVRLAAQQLAALLTLFPVLRSQLQLAAHQRDRLLFFKTLTAFHACSSHHLSQFLPLMVEQSIPKGESLAASSKTEHFWLRQGTILTPEARTIGFDWSDSAHTDWIAHTDLQVYILPAEHWQKTQTLIPALKSAAEHPDQKPSTRIAKSPMPPQYLHQKAAADVDSTLPDQGAIAFPKPVKRRFSNFLQRYPWVEQQSSSDCGAACLAMLCRFWGKPIPLNTLREQANVGRAGASLKSLAKAAESIGFHGRPVRANLLRMAEQSEPWIAHWEGMHYVVVYQIKGNRVMLADPAIGRRTLTQEAFQAHWTGYALLLEPTPNLSAATPKSSFGRYFNCSNHPLFGSDSGVRTDHAAVDSGDSRSGSGREKPKYTERVHDWTIPIQYLEHWAVLSASIFVGVSL
jgi:ATP-binding cassette, subfamily B, bacterial HlyB/CyaB